MKKTIVLLALVAIAAPAFAAHMATAEPAPFGMLPAIGGSARTDVVYSNTTTGANGAFSQVAGAEIGDDLELVSGGVLDTLKFSVYNSSTSAGPLSGMDLTIKFYDLSTDGTNVTMTPAGSLTATGVTLASPLAVGYYTTFSLTGLESNNITLSDWIAATLTITNLQGGASKVGQVMYDPPTVGASTDNFYLDNGTNIGWYWFSGSPVANFYWEIGVVPEPASLLLIAVGALALRRR